MNSKEMQEYATKHELLQRIAVLEKERDEARSKGQFIGVKNTYNGECWVRPVGAKEDGTEDIKIPGNEARPIPALTWEYLLNTNADGVESGQLIRDDKILGNLGYEPTKQNFNEYKRFPNMVSDLDIEAWYRLSVSKFAERINLIDSVPVLERVLEHGINAKKRKDSHIQVVKDRIFKVSSPLPKDFDSENKMEEIVRIASMLNISLKKENFDVRTGSVEELKNIIRTELELRKSAIVLEQNRVE